MAESGRGERNGRTGWCGHRERVTESHVRAERRLTSQRQTTINVRLIQMISHFTFAVVQFVTALAVHLIWLAFELLKVNA